MLYEEQGILVNMKDKFKVYTITDQKWKDEAWDTAIKRRKYHAALGSKKHWSDPDKGEYTDEYFGSLGHIVWREKILEIGLGPVSEFAPLYTDNLSELPAWDSKILGKTTDQKTIPPDTNKIRKRMLIKLSEYKNLDFYVAIKFWNEDEYSFCGMVSRKRIKDEGDEHKSNFGFAEAYWFLLDDLKPVEFTINGKKIIL